MSTNMVQFIPQHNIDREKWDACIMRSGSPVIYARYEFLQCMAGQWDALVYGDYEMVMPLTWRKKYGISYLYQPAFTQQLGIFSSQEITGEWMSLFFIAASKHFRFAEIYLNESNDAAPIEPVKLFAHGFKYNPRTNYVLSLKGAHETIQSHYREAVLRNIRKAKRAGLRVSNDTQIKPIIDDYRIAQQKNMKHLSIDDYKKFSRVCDLFSSRGMVITRSVLNNQNERMAGAMLINDGKRLYNIITHITPQGRDLGANHLLYDELLKEYAATGSLFDFEGSEIPGVRQFYQGFGAVNRPFYFLRYNELPWPIRKMKNG